MAGMTARSMPARIGIAFLQAIGLGLLTCIVSFWISLFITRNDPDGQAGMGAMVGTLLIGIATGVATFIGSLFRSRERR
jgi:hypothetical protein